jgi:hypothetical protein
MIHALPLEACSDATLVGASSSGPRAPLGAGTIRGHELLQQAVLQAVRKWRFTPQLESGKPVESRVAVMIKFQGVSRIPLTIEHSVH